MAREYAIHLVDPDGNAFALLPDDEIPEWAVEQLDARHLDGEKSASTAKSTRRSSPASS